MKKITIIDQILLKTARITTMVPDSPQNKPEIDLITPQGAIRVHFRYLRGHQDCRRKKALHPRDLVDLRPQILDPMTDLNSREIRGKSTLRDPRPLIIDLITRWYLEMDKVTP